MYPSVALIQFDFSGIGFSKNLQTCIDIGVGIMLVWYTDTLHVLVSVLVISVKIDQIAIGWKLKICIVIGIDIPSYIGIG